MGSWFDYSDITGNSNGYMEVMMDWDKHTCCRIARMHPPNTLLLCQKPTLETSSCRYNLSLSFHSTIPRCDCQSYRLGLYSKYSSLVLERSLLLGTPDHHLLDLCRHRNLSFQAQYRLVLLRNSNGDDHLHTRRITNPPPTY